MKSHVYSDTIQLEIKTDEQGRKHYNTKGFMACAKKDKVGDSMTDNCVMDMSQQVKNTDTYFYGSQDHEHIVAGDPTILPRARLIDGEVSEKLCDDGNVYKGVWITDELNQYHPEFENYKDMIENEWLGSYSIEFLKPKANEFIRTPEGGRILNKINLTGYAHTARPINPECTMTDFIAKSMAAINDHTAEEAESATPPVDEKTKSEVKMENEKTEAPVEAPVETPTETPVVEEKTEKVEASAEEKTEEKVEEKTEEKVAEPEAPKEEIKSLTLENIRKVIQDEFKSLMKETESKNVLPATEEKFEQEKKSQNPFEGSFADQYARKVGVEK